MIIIKTSHIQSNPGFHLQNGMNVSSNNHSIGFKKFGDLQIESRNNEQPLMLGLTTALTDLTIDYGIDEYVDMNCVYDFDLGRENNINFDETSVLSDEIVFKSSAFRF